MVRRGLAALLAVLAGCALYIGVTLPARRVTLTAPVPPAVVFGGYHLHSSRSDGSGAPDDVARAAAGAGLQFIILTDHGDATRAPDPPEYRHGVLVVDAAEISTTGGHVVALHLAAAAPYPLAGEPRDVIEDIHRLGGWAFVAHPDSPKPALRWTAWDTPYDGVEWINADSEWRDESAMHLAMTLARSVVRGPEAIASLFTRPDRTITRWDGVTRRRPVVAVGALDAHAHFLATDGGQGLTRGPAFPSYAEMFGTIAQAAVLDAPLTGNAAADAARVLEAIHGGRTFTIVRAIAGPAVLEFTATQADAAAGMGGRLDRAGVDTTFRAAVPGAAAARVALIFNGREVRAGKGRVEFAASAAPGVYRVEVTYPGVEVPWLLSNPIYVGPRIEPVPDAVMPDPAPVMSLPPGGAWAIEHQPASSGTVTVEDQDLRFTYALDSNLAGSPYAALVSPVGGAAGIGRVEFVGRADRPMRVSVQLRLPGARDDRRWQRSVYLDQSPRQLVIPVTDFEPTGAPTSLRPTVAMVQSLLFVVDTVNTRPGSRGTLWLSKVVLAGG